MKEEGRQKKELCNKFDEGGGESKGRDGGGDKYMAESTPLVGVRVGRRG